MHGIVGLLYRWQARRGDGSFNYLFRYCKERYSRKLLAGVGKWAHPCNRLTRWFHLDVKKKGHFGSKALNLMEHGHNRNI